MIRKKIHSVEFGVLGPAMIRKMSAVEIKSPETYDKDGYPMEGGLMDPHLGVINPGLRCKTCGQKMKQCPGHFGSIELVRPVIHSEFSPKVEELLYATCGECGRIMIAQDKLNELKQRHRKGMNFGKLIVRKIRRLNKCPHCKASKGLVLIDKPTNYYIDKDRLYPTQIREWLEKIPNEDLWLFGYDTERIRPEWFVLTVLQVPSITVRPSITLDNGIRSEDDLSHKLVDIIRINLRLKDNIEAGAPQLIIEDLWDLLQYHVTTYFDNDTAGIAPSKHRTGRPLRTLAQRLKGKRGRFRYNLIGKRVNSAARSTISPDAYINISELGVPEIVANELTVPEAVTDWNLKEVTELIKKTNEVDYIIRPTGMRRKITEENKKEIIEELAPGIVIERKLRNGDIVLFNRQPSLHRLSMLAHKVRIMDGKTFRLNPMVCKPYNADFDGDEMNLHVPQTEEGKAEARELMYVQDQIISPRYGAPIIVPAEDGISSAVILTLKSTSFDRGQAMQLLWEAGIKELPEADSPGERYSGKLIFSQLLPKDLNLEYKTTTCNALRQAGICKDCTEKECPNDAYLRIENGKLVSGVIDTASLGEIKGKLVDVLARNYPSSVISEFYEKLARIAIKLISLVGLTIGLDEYTSTDKMEKVKAHVLERLNEESKNLVEAYEKKTLEIIPGKNLDESFELKMMQLATRVKRDLEKEIISEKIPAVLKEKPVFNTTLILVGGARGGPDNLTNIMGFLGQASVREGRPKRGFKNRLITLNERGDVGSIAGGFVKHSYMEGIAPKEYFYHSMGGRQGEVDTGVSTKVSGYLYRRFANALKDLIAKPDLSVRTANNDLIQFVYGEDGVFPMKSVKGKIFDVDNEVIWMKAKQNPGEKK